MYLPKRIISVICAITIVFLCISPTIVYAATDSYIPVTFWEYVYRYGFSGGNRPGGFGGGGFGGSGSSSGSGSGFGETGGGSSGGGSDTPTTPTWTSPDDMKLDYNQYVDQLPATGYTSDGKLIWQPNWSDCSSDVGQMYVLCDNKTVFSVRNSELVSISEDIVPYVSVSVTGPFVSFVVSKTESSTLTIYYNSFKFVVPITDKYAMVKSLACDLGFESRYQPKFFDSVCYYWDPASWRYPVFSLTRPQGLL